MTSSIGIKLSNVRNVNINSDKYYIFVKVKSKDMLHRFYKQLLEQHLSEKKMFNTIIIFST